MYHPFSIAETLKTAWNIFRRNFITIIVYSVVVFFVIFILGLVLAAIFNSTGYYTDLLVSFIIIVFQAYTTLGLYKLIFTLIDSEFYEFEFSQILPRFTNLVSYLVVEFLFAAIFVAYKLFLDKVVTNEVLNDIFIFLGVIVMLYLVLRVMFFNTFIVDDNSGPFESIKQSVQLTKGYFLKVLSILGVIIVLIAIPAQISQFFPLASLFIIFSYPFVNIILMVTYRKLVYSHQDVDDDVTETI